MTRVKVLVCDYDGTLAFALPQLQQNYVSAAKQCALPVPPLEMYLEGVWNGEHEGPAGLSAFTRDVWPGINDAAVQLFVATLKREESQHPYELIPGVVELIRDLRQQNIKIGLCTLNPDEGLRQRMRSQRLSEDLFDAITTSNSGSVINGKKSLESLLATLGIQDRTSVESIGDWGHDLRAAQSANVGFNAVLSGFLRHHAFVAKGVPPERILETILDFPRAYGL